MKLINSLFTLLILTGCVGTSHRDLVTSGVTWNVPETGSIKFDNSKFIQMSRMACEKIGIELFQDTQKAMEGKVLMRAGLLKDWENISDSKSVSFNVDGKFSSFSPTDVYTNHEESLFSYGIGVDSEKFSYRKYILPEDFIRKIAKANDVFARIYFLNGDYLDGRCTPMTIEEWKNIAKPSDSKYVTQKNLDYMNSLTAINGFREFVDMMDRTQW